MSGAPASISAARWGRDGSMFTVVPYLQLFLPLMRSGARRRELRGGIGQLGQIRGARPRVQLGEQAVVARLGLQFRYAARGILDVAKDDGFGWARPLAGGDHIAVRHLVVFQVE